MVLYGDAVFCPIFLVACEQVEMALPHAAVLCPDIGTGAHHLLDGAVGKTPVVVFECDSHAT